MSSSPIIKQDEFRAERQGVLGGSDTGGLYNLPPYGCTLRTFKQKRGDVSDVPFYGNNATARGQRWERIAAEIYGERTGRDIRKASPKNDAVVPRLRPQPDFEIINNARGTEFGRGILSVKVPGAEMFRKLKSAILAYKELKNPKNEWEKKLVEDGKAALMPYELQLQAEMGAQKVLWGDYALLWLDGDDLVSLGYQEADQEIIADIRARAEDFWKMFDAGVEPPKLDADSKQCRHCEFRLSCQSKIYESAFGKEKAEGQIVLLEGLATIVEQYEEVKSIIKDAEDEKDKLAADIKKFMGPYSMAEDGTFKVYNTLMKGRETFQKDPLIKHIGGLAEDAARAYKAFKDAESEDDVEVAIKQTKPILEYLAKLPEDIKTKFTKRGEAYPQLRVYQVRSKTQLAEGSATEKVLTK